MSFKQKLGRRVAATTGDAAPRVAPKHGAPLGRQLSHKLSAKQAWLSLLGPLNKLGGAGKEGAQVGAQERFVRQLRRGPQQPSRGECPYSSHIAIT